MTQPYFANIREHISTRLDLAEGSIDIAMAWFTNPVIYDVLLSRAANGIKVNLLISDSEANFRPGSSLDFSALTRKKMDVRIFRTTNGRFMHHKFCIIDNKDQLATKFVLMYIGSQQLIGAFINSGNQPDINDITAIMAQDLFNIKLHNGVPDKKYDHDLLNDLQSGQSQQICLAILKVIYQVRCNLVHGSKNYQEYQRILLEPLSRLLITLQQQLFQKLT